jgi:hypothetical protein
MGYGEGFIKSVRWLKKPLRQIIRLRFVENEAM